MAQLSMFPEAKTPELTEHDQPMAKSDLSIQPGEMLRIGRHELYCGDCVEVMKGFPDNSVDCIVTDPPYGINFMSGSIKWDSSIPDNEWAKECLRILKPGGHLIAFAATRTFHRLGMVVEQSGFEIRDTINWLYFSGFPKSLSVDKSLDSHFGAEREIIGKSQRHGVGKLTGKAWNIPPEIPNITKPKTKEAIQYSGYGTALKPSFEPAILARKPLSEKTIALNVLEWGTGGINIDGCRFGYGDPCWVGPNDEVGPRSIGGYRDKYVGGKIKKNFSTNDPGGRWPANIYQCPKASRSERELGCDELPVKSGAEAVNRKPGSAGMDNPRAGAGRTAETVKNFHPTVKPVKLMKWLASLVMPPHEDAVLLDTFMGSGSTIVAAQLCGFRSIGIDLEPDYIRIAHARVQNAIPKWLRGMNPDPLPW